MRIQVEDLGLFLSNMWYYSFIITLIQLCIWNYYYSLYPSCYCYCYCYWSYSDYWIIFLFRTMWLLYIVFRFSSFIIWIRFYSILSYETSTVGYASVNLFLIINYQYLPIHDALIFYIHSWKLIPQSYPIWSAIMRPTK